MKHNQKLGRFGEELAKKYLQRKKYKILATNVRIGRGELDIVCEDDEELVFVEVKTRASETYGCANEAVFSRKANNIKRAVSAYLNILETKKYYRDIRLDLIAIDIDKKNNNARVRHYRNIA